MNAKIYSVNVSYNSGVIAIWFYRNSPAGNLHYYDIKTEARRKRVNRLLLFRPQDARVQTFCAEDYLTTGSFFVDRLGEVNA